MRTFVFLREESFIYDASIKFVSFHYYFLIS